MPCTRNNVNSNYYICYDKSFGQYLMSEARQRGLTRSQLVRRACDDYLARNPGTNIDNVKK
jgi:hypothetical protein